MEQISLYLEKFKNLEVKGDKLKQSVIDVLKEEVGVELNKKDILILKNGTIKILKIGPEKSVVFLNKKKIEEKIEKQII